MEFVGAYRDKSKLAKALRRRESAIGSMQVDSSPLVTQASGAFPGQVNANYGAPLAQIGLALMSKTAGEKADAAEKDAETARSQAIEQVLGGGAAPNVGTQGPAGGGTLATGAPQVTPQSVMAMQELGLDPSVLKMFQKKDPQLGAVTQAAQTPQGIQALVNAGVWTPEQGQHAIQEYHARENERKKAEEQKYLFEQQNKAFKPTDTRGQKETELEFYQRDPEGYAAMMKLKGSARAGNSQNPYTKKLAEEQAKVDVKLMEGSSKIEAGIARADDLIKKYTDKPYKEGTKWRAADLAAQMVGTPQGKLPSDFDPEVQLQEQAASQFHLDAMEQMRGFGQVTEAEQAIIKATQFDRYDDESVRLKKIETIKGALVRGLQKVRAAQERMAKGVAVLPQAGTITSKSGIQFTVEPE